MGNIHHKGKGDSLRLYIQVPNVGQGDHVRRSMLTSTLASFSWSPWRLARNLHILDGEASNILQPNQQQNKYFKKSILQVNCWSCLEIRIIFISHQYSKLICPYNVADVNLGSWSPTIHGYFYLSQWTAFFSFLIVIWGIANEKLTIFFK